jgi:hypothetical protein
VDLSVFAALVTFTVQDADSLPALAVTFDVPAFFAEAFPVFLLMVRTLVLLDVKVVFFASLDGTTLTLKVRLFPSYTEVLAALGATRVIEVFAFFVAACELKVSAGMKARTIAAASRTLVSFDNVFLFILILLLSFIKMIASSFISLLTYYILPPFFKNNS